MARFGKALAALTMLIGGLVAAIPAASAATATLDGIVRDEGGSPVDGATVKLLQPGTLTSLAQTTTDGSGYYSLTASSGTYDLLAFTNAGLSDRVSGVALADGPNTLDITVRPLVATVSGVVTSIDGLALANRSVSFHCSSNGASGNALTDGNGYYQLSMLPGTNCVANANPTYYDISGGVYMMGSRFSGLDLSTSQTLDLAIPGPQHTLTVNVVRPDGTPAAVTRVQLAQGSFDAIGSYSGDGWNYWDSTANNPATLRYFTRTGVFNSMNTWSHGLNISVQLANGITLNHTIDATTNPTEATLLLTRGGIWFDGAPEDSNDGDNVSDVVEAGAPNNGDGNNDGTPDYEQANVTSYPSSSGDYVTLQSPPGTDLVNVRTIDPATYNPPPGATLPEGLTDFKLDDVIVGGDVTFTIYSSNTVGVTGYAKYQDGIWTMLPEDRVEILADRVEITLTDGGVGDDDGIANGVIVDPGGPVVVTDGTPPTITCPSSQTFLLNQAGATITATVSDDGSGVATSTVTAAVATATVGAGTAQVAASDLAGNSTTIDCGYQVRYGTGTGLLEPITPNVENTAKAGSTIPVKWRLTDANGAAVSTTGSFVGVTAAIRDCQTGVTTDEIEATSTTSGLQYLGNGNWQYNWKTVRGVTGCRTVALALADGTTLTAEFRLR